MKHGAERTKAEQSSQSNNSDQIHCQENFPNYFKDLVPLQKNNRDLKLTDDFIDNTLKQRLNETHSHIHLT